MFIKYKHGLGIQIFLLLMLIFFSQSAWAQKTDIVYLKNGDRITGEVKSMGRGKLELSTDHMGTLFIEWEQILQLTSNTGQAVELTNGQRVYGSLEKSEDENTVVVNTPIGPANLNVNEVFAMYPVESKFWDRLDLNIDLGVSWDKGSQVGKYNLGIESKYRRPESITTASFSTEITTQSSEDNTQRTALSGMHNIYKPNKRFHTYFGNLEKNDQLGVDLRALVGAGYGWVPVRSQRNWFSFALGLDVNHEIPTTGESQTNLEAVAWFTYEYYKFSTPERSFTTNFIAFPSITDFGRWRLSYSSDFRWEIVTDLFWKLSLYADYDTAPISSEAASSDYGVISSLGYKF